MDPPTAGARDLPSSDEKPPTCCEIWARITALAVFIAWFIIFDKVIMKTTYPTFQIDSLSVFVTNTTNNNESSRATAQWDLGFSLEKLHDYNLLKDLSAWLRCTSTTSEWSGKSGIALHKELGHKAFGNVSFDTPWAREGFESKGLGCELTFKGNYDDNVITAECKNVTVAVVGGHRGIMIGGPKLCGKTKHKVIRFYH
ncbi:Unknown protein [Striga hermonthica]|uniref:Uncharacterized protein n=1 Tax=Striga hermonthica TaxID=68872 RepID=A0A9N7N448_STRHE|nr:Unknown protein [Striga hermonthica]